jgi:hypothetical protein
MQAFYEIRKNLAVFKIHLGFTDGNLLSTPKTLQKFLPLSTF